MDVLREFDREEEAAVFIQKAEEGVPPDAARELHCIQVQCFWKGTAFPASYDFANLGEWKEAKAKWSDNLVKGMMAGHSLNDQSAGYKSQMDNWEQHVRDAYHPSLARALTLTREQRLHEIPAILGIGGDQGQGMWQWREWWFRNVMCLLKTKTISDNDMFGWLISGPGHLLSDCIDISSDMDIDFLVCDHDQTDQTTLPDDVSSMREPMNVNDYYDEVVMRGDAAEVVHRAREHRRA